MSIPHQSGMILLKDRRRYTHRIVRKTFAIYTTKSLTLYGWTFIVGFPRETEEDFETPAVF
jgi:tRNA A37 methylthiotransferase MiaB